MGGGGGVGPNIKNKILKNPIYTVQERSVMLNDTLMMKQKTTKIALKTREYIYISLEQVQHSPR